MGSECQNDIHPQGNHVLLVDDTQSSLLESLLILGKASLKVTPTRKQQVALTLLQEFKTQYGLVITSDRNKGMNCYSFLHRVRFIRGDIPIVVLLSGENIGDQGLRTVFDSACYVIKKPLTEMALRCIWQQHVVRRTLVARREIKGHKRSIEKNAGPKGKGYASEKVEENVAKEDKGKEEQERVEVRVKTRGRPKRSMPRDGENKAAKKKGKSVAEPNEKGKSVAEPNELMNSRPIFDDEQHKRFLQAIQYSGPTKPIRIGHYLPRGGVSMREHVSPAQKSPLPDKKLLPKQKNGRVFSTKPRAAWSQHIYEKYVEAASHNNVPGITGNIYGAQQASSPQFPWSRVPPSWMSPQDWRTKMDSEFLNSRMGKFPVFESAAPPKPPTTFNGGLNPTTLEIPATQNAQTTHRLGFGFSAQDDSQHGHATSLSANTSALFGAAENTGSEITQKPYVFGEDKASFGSRFTESSHETTTDLIISPSEVDQWLNLDADEEQDAAAVLDPAKQALQEPKNPNTQQGSDYMDDIFAFIDSYQVGTDSSSQIFKVGGNGENNGGFNFESLGFNYGDLDELPI